MNDSTLENRIKAAQNSYYLGLKGLGLAELPDEIWNLSHLEELDLSHNTLSGLPDMFSTLPNLTALNLGDNHIEELPPSISACSKLRIIQAERNRLAELPKDFKKHSNWSVFGLSGNRFQKLPPWLSKLDFVQLLALDRNQIETISEKELPKYLFNLTLQGNPVHDHCPPEVKPYLTLNDIPLGTNPQIEFPPQPGRKIEWENGEGYRIVVDFIGIRTYSPKGPLFRSTWEEVFSVNPGETTLDLTTSRNGYIDRVDLKGFDQDGIAEIEKNIRIYWQGFRLYKVYDVNWSDESLSWNE